MTQFANLPDDCYLLIFVRLSTSTLLSCRRVSRAWLRNQQQVFRQRKVLILLQGNVQLLTESYFQGEFISHGIDQNGQPMDFDHFLQHNQVKLRSFDQNVTHFLAVTFPNVDTLIVVHDDIPSQNVNKPLIELLQLLSSKVVTLKLYFNYRGEYCDVINQNIRKVIRQLNYMGALEHVTVESPNHSTLSLKMCYKNLQFLARVKQFYFYSKKISPSWFDVLRRLEQTDSVSQLEQIAVGRLSARPIVNWPLANRFTHLPCSLFMLNLRENNFEKSIGHFRSLTTFTTDDHGTRSLSSQLTILSRHCLSLVHISIQIRKDSLFAQPFDPSTIKPFESVKALDLMFDYSTRINLDAQVRPLVYTFPNLISIRITNYTKKPNRNAEFVTFLRQLKTAFGRESIRTSCVVE